MKISETKSLIRKNEYKHYVYGIISPSGKPFYIGKGQDYRFQLHLAEAINTDNKNLKLSIIRGIIKSNKRLNYKIYGFYKTDEIALVVEKFLILYYGRIDLKTGILTNLTDGGGPRNCAEESLKKLSDSIKNYVLTHPIEHKSYQKNATKVKQLPEVRNKYRKAQLDYMKSFPDEHVDTMAKTHKTRRKPENRKANSKRLKEYFKDPKARKKNSEAQKLAHKRKRLVIDRCKNLIDSNFLNIQLPSTTKSIKVFEELEKKLLELI
jgi:hypothetical protein